MSPAFEAAVDHLSTMVQVIRADRVLTSWFSDLTRLSAVERRNAIFGMSEKLRAQGQDPALVGCFLLLSNAQVFEAARLALE
jgi:hypothetical protein